jgi:hypothetical protein
VSPIFSSVSFGTIHYSTPLARREKKWQSLHLLSVEPDLVQKQPQYDHACQASMNMGETITYFYFIIGDNQWFLAWTPSTAAAMART